jgi:2-polyprenyl-6-methoxyphenol hydroxylase-like FAD-dependent oxidoreductase
MRASDDKVRQVLIVGGGIGGLTAATALAQRSIGADVVEIRTNDDRLGVGMIQPANALRALSTIGLLDSCLDAGFASDERRYFDAAGRELVAYTSGRSAGRHFPAANCVPRPALHAILKDAAQQAGASVTLGTTAIEMTQVPDGVEVQLSDGRRRLYDLVIGADGIRSRVREDQLGGRREPDFSGYGCWRVSLPRPPEITYHGIYQGINGTKAGLVPLTRETMYLYLVTNEPGNPWMAPERLHDLLRDRLYGYEGVIGEIRDSLNEPKDVVYTPLEEVALAAPWFRGSVVLIGDAAHASLPHMAQGAAMAVEDAVVLAELASADLTTEARLENFMARRYERCRYIQETSRRTADDQQGSDPGQVAAHQEYLRENFPKLWTHSEHRLAEPI